MEEVKFAPENQGPGVEFYATSSYGKRWGGMTGIEVMPLQLSAEEQPVVAMTPLHLNGGPTTRCVIRVPVNEIDALCEALQRQKEALT